MNKRAYKDEVYSEVARMAKAISSAARLEIIDFIANGEKSVDDIARQTGLSRANASQHLQKLKRERLVKARKRGVQVFYTLVSREVYQAWKSLRDVALQLSPQIKGTMEQFRTDHAFPAPVTLEYLRGRSDVYLLDVRPRDEYRTRHIPGSASIPLDELADHWSDLPKDKLIVAYCRGMFCTMADEAVALLRAKGYEAQKLDISVQEY